MSLNFIDELLVISYWSTKDIITLLLFSTSICLQSFNVMITGSDFQSPLLVMLEKFPHTYYS